MPKDDDEGPDGVVSVAFGVGLALAFFVFSGIALTQGLKSIEPRIGDIVVFVGKQQLVGAPQADIRAFVAERHESPNRQRTCILHPQAMVADGGSLVIEAMDPDGTLPYRVHWAGGPTAFGRSNCGDDADLLLSSTDIAALAIAAGGFGVGEGRRPAVQLSLISGAYVP
jgi:hypothetical protein